MSARTLSRTGRLALTALALAAVATGCGESGQGSDRAEKKPSASPSPSSSPTQTKPSARPDRARKGTARLLTAREMPGFNESFRWRVGSTRTREDRRPFGTCHRFPMMSVGATEVAVRGYEPVGPADGVTAAHLVADFVDPKTAQRAYEVLKSWREQCADQLRRRYDRVEVNGLQSVEIPGSGGATAGNWYLLVYGPASGERDAGYFDAQGFTRVGSTISVLQMRLVGQDYNYPSGREPMVQAVTTAAAKLGAG